MEQLWQIIEGTRASTGYFTPVNVLLSMLLAFVLGQVLAWVYYFTHSGLSYSRTYVQSLVLICVIVAIIMAVIGNNIITAFGLMGALAIIRFRNVIKDTRDIVFIFCALVIGMACGSQRFAIAIVGTALLSLVTVYLHASGFGTHQPHNGFLRFNCASHIGPDHPVIEILKRFCGSYALVSAQHGYDGGVIEYAYQLIIKNAERNEQMLSELEKIEGVANINLTMQEQLLEV